MNHKTRDEIRAEIYALRAIKPCVPETNAYGDDQHGAIDAQCVVLYEQLTSDQVHHRFGNADYPEDVLFAALEAHNWMTGAVFIGAQSPSMAWADRGLRAHPERA